MRLPHRGGALADAVEPSRQLAILRAVGLVDTRRDGSWVYYRLVEQEHAAVQSVLDEVTGAFGAERKLRSDLVKLRKSCGPDACK